MGKYSMTCTLAAAALAIFAMRGTSPAAEPHLSVSSILLCDKVENVAPFFAAAAQAENAAVEESKDEAAKPCGVVTALFMTESEPKTILVTQGIVHVVKINMLGVRAGNTWVKMAKPVPAFACTLEAATMT